ncbi:unnamed protein product [Hymenolepis diminuta]|uniref:Uncharacterized protein n=1 Tax=Hymenolepis diminuta TaxID=6216 RepID=A0A564Y637_HYMDI|nr:unnamed protein product [Hymenolepis diminuta]
MVNLTRDSAFIDSDNTPMRPVLKVYAFMPQSAQFVAVSNLYVERKPSPPCPFPRGWHFS